MQKGAGLGALTRSSKFSAQYAQHGNVLKDRSATALSTQLTVFQAALREFSRTHAKDIRSNPTFRAEFARMCAAIGVDPLASSSKGGGGGGGGGGGSFWAEMLGADVGDFYFGLAVRVVEVCRATREQNGGLIAVTEVRERLGKEEITE
jgi:ESCRT-II complex subunit VPS22